jgi:phage tail sheath protein FI
MPANLTYPGVYIDELPSGVHTITGVATSIATFVGWASQGPTNEATLIESWSQFQTQFGGFSQSNGSPNYLGYAVNQFFNNGGQQAFIVRLVADGNDGTITAGLAVANLTDINNNVFLTLQAANPGNWATNYGILIKVRTDDPTRFSLSVVYVPAGANPQVAESFQNLSLSPSDPLYVVRVINSDSNYVAFAPGYAPPTSLLPPSSNIPTTPFMLVGTLPIFLQDASAPPNTYLEIQANQPSKWPANFAVSVKSATNGLGNNFDLEVLYHPAGGAVGLGSAPILVESFPNLSVNPNDSNYAATVINAASNFLVVPSAYTPIANAATVVLSLPSVFPSAPTAQLVTSGSISLQDHSSPPISFLTLQASAPSEWPPNFGVLTQADGTGFDLEVAYYPAGGTAGKVALPVVLESFKGLSVSAPNISASQFIALPPGYTAPSPAPQLSLPKSFPSVPTMLVPNLDGTVLRPNTAAFENKLLDTHGDGTHGVYELERVPIFNLLCVPGESSKLGASAAVLAQLQAFCVLERAFLIIDSDVTDTHLSLQQNGLNSALLGAASTNGALYFPWIQAPDPLFGNRLTYFPPCGFVAGIYAATDSNRGVWKAPAGIDAALTGVSGLQYNLTDLENGDLNVQAINCLRQFRAYGNVVWGARTLQGSDQAGSQWKYVPIRRLALYLESSLYDGTQWVVFEPNDETLWGQIRLNVGAFMQGLFLQGAFQGGTPAQAYFVKCDSENNPQSSIDQGIVNILVGFAPLHPAEFVVIQIQQLAGQLQS